MKLRWLVLAAALFVASVAATLILSGKCEPGSARYTIGGVRIAGC